MRERVVQNAGRCNPEQKAIVNKVLEMLLARNTDTKFMSIEAAAGTGKTFILNLILAMVRQAGDIAIATASKHQQLVVGQRKKLQRTEVIFITKNEK